MSGESIFLAVGFAVVGLWLILVLARLQDIWSRATKQTGNLQVALINAEQRRNREQDQVKKIEEEVRKTREQAVTEQKSRDERAETMLAVAPKDPEEIQVVSEFSTATQDVPWVAHYQRLDSKSRRAVKDGQYWTLFWAVHQGAATQRAEQVMKEGFMLAGVRKFK